MKPYLPLFGVCFALVLASAHAIAERQARVYDIDNIVDIEVGGASRLVLVQGNSDSLRVEGKPEVLQRVIVDQEGRHLTLTVKSKTNDSFSFPSLFKNDTPTFYLQLKNLNSLKLQGASQGQVSKWAGKSLAVNLGGASELEIANLTLDDLQVELGGASNITVQDLSAGNASFRISGASDAKVTGQSHWLKVEAGGASDYHGKSLKAARAELQANGASDIDAYVTEQLKAEAHGASDIHYLGNPSVQTNTSGASDINAI